MPAPIETLAPILDIKFRPDGRDLFFVGGSEQRLKSHLQRVSNEYKIKPDMYRWGQLVAWLLCCEHLHLRNGGPVLDRKILSGFRDPAATVANWRVQHLASAKDRIYSGALIDPGGGEIYLPGSPRIARRLRSSKKVIEGLLAAKFAFDSKVIQKPSNVLGDGIDGSFLEEVTAFHEMLDEFLAEYKKRFLGSFEKSNFRVDLVFPKKLPLDAKSIIWGADLSASLIVKTYLAAVKAVFDPILAQVGSMRERDRGAKTSTGQLRSNGFLATCAEFHFFHLFKWFGTRFDRNTITDRARKSPEFQRLAIKFEKIGNFKVHAREMYLIGADSRRKSG